MTKKICLMCEKWAQDNRTCLLRQYSYCYQVREQRPTLPKGYSLCDILPSTFTSRGRPGDRGSIPGTDRIFPVASVSRPALGPTQSPVQWVPGVLCPGLKRVRGVTLTTRPYLLQRSRMNRSYTSSPPRTFIACGGTSLALGIQNQTPT
jgi:hypothetical protein